MTDRVHPVLAIAGRELRELVRDGRLPWGAVLMLALTIAAVVVGWQHFSVARAERSAAMALDYDAWVAQPERHPHDAAHQGMHVFKHMPPLAVLDPGLDPYVGTTQWLRAHRQSEVKFRPAQDATGLERFGSLSTAWILQVLAPLVVILLGFGAIAGERERGTLRQLMSLGVTPRQIMLGKATGVGTATLILLLPAGIASAIAVLMAAPAAERVDALARFLALSVGYAVYVAIFVALVLGVSARARSAGAALLACLALWIGIAILAPRLMADFSRALHPGESRQTFSAKLNQALSTEEQRAWTQHFGRGTAFGTEVPVSQWGIGLKINDQAGYAVLDEHFNALWDTFERQQRVQVVSGLLFPTIALRAFSMGIAGTDFEEHRIFSTAAERQRRVIQDLVSHDLEEHADNRAQDYHFQYRASKELWAEVPAFSYPVTPLHSSLAASALSVCVMGGALALAIVFASIAPFRRWLA